MPEEKKDWVSFEEVKKAVSIDMVLLHYDIPLKQKNATSWRGKCPLPTHTGDSENSFSVNTEKNAWACHVASCKKARGGRKGKVEGREVIRAVGRKSETSSDLYRAIITRCVSE